MINYSKGAKGKVLRMAQKAYIKDLYENEGKSLRAIARQTGHHFDTVKKYAHQTNFNQSGQLPERTMKFNIIADYIPIIDIWLEQDVLEPRKQRHTISRVFCRLRDEHNYKGSYNSVKRYYNYKKAQLKKHHEGFLPLAKIAGFAQADFGEFKYYDALGSSHKAYALVVSFPHSNAAWMQVFPSENQECLLEGLKKVFYHIGGVPIRIKLDNMTTAVAQILRGNERVVTDGFYRFMLHHRFGADFCTPGKGNEKGNVENKVGYTRRNLLTPVPTITDFAAFNKELLHRCDTDHNRRHYSPPRRVASEADFCEAKVMNEQDTTITELWSSEKSQLLTLPEYEYQVFRYESLSVNKNGFVILDTNKYGLSPELYGKVVQVKIYFDKIEVYHDNIWLKTFERSYERNAEVACWKTYLPTLIRKPGATEHTRSFDQMPKLWKDYIKSVHGRDRKSALMLLSEIVDDGNELLCDEALEMAHGYGKVDTDNIRQCYMFISRPEYHPSPLKLSSEATLSNYSPDLSAYDVLYSGYRDDKQGAGNSPAVILQSGFVGQVEVKGVVQGE